MNRFVFFGGSVFSVVFRIASIASLAACAPLTAVQPWEKGQLARPVMALDRDTLDAKLSEHLYFSKEAASGGNSVGGGGCGCN